MSDNMLLGHGSRGRRIEVTTNYYEMSLLKCEGTLLYLYEIRFATISPHGDREIRKNRELCNRIFWTLVERCPEVFGNRRRVFVYDDVFQLYSLVPLRNFRGRQLEPDDEPLTWPFNFDDGDGSGTHRVRVYLRKTGEFAIGQAAAAEQPPSYNDQLLQFLNRLFTQSVRCTTEEIAKRWFAERNCIYYCRPQPHLSSQFPLYLGDCQTLIKGLHASIKLDEHGLPIANIDLKHSAFFTMEMELLEYYIEIVNGFTVRRPQDLSRLRDYGMSSSQRARMDQALAGIRLCTKEHPRFHKRYYKYHRLIPHHSEEYVFQHPQFGRISVNEYFQRMYGRRLRFPHMPLIQLHPPDRNLMMPMEFLVISDHPQRIRRELLPDILKRISSQVVVHPPVRFGQISELVEASNALDNAFLGEFGVRMSSEMLTIDEARVLDKPHCHMDDRHAGSVPLQPLCVTNRPTLFVVVWWSEQFSGSQIEQGVNVLIRSYRNNGMTFHPRQYFLERHSFRRDNHESATHFLRALTDEVLDHVGGQRLERGTQQHNVEPHLLFLIVSGRKDGNPKYDMIKKICEINLGIMTQFLTEHAFEKVLSNSPSILNNLFLKINEKLYGTNNRIRDSFAWTKFANAQESTLFLGISIFQPFRNDNMPSLAAIAYNLDVHCTKFRDVFDVNHNINLVPLLGQALHNFSKENRAPPAHIVVYRSGVSDSTFEETAYVELGEFTSAFRAFSERFARQLAGRPFAPTISYIFVQKQHSTRFCAEVTNVQIGSGGGKRNADNNGNVPSGTVVDTRITRNERVLVAPHRRDAQIVCYHDFYLCSQRGILGTSRPAHYTMIYNTWRSLTADEIQSLTFALCHLIPRSFATVSVPVVVHSAGLVLERLRRIVKVWLGVDATAAGGALRVHDNVADRPYWT